MGDDMEALTNKRFALVDARMRYLMSVVNLVAREIAQSERCLAIAMLSLPKDHEKALEELKDARERLGRIEEHLDYGMREFGLSNAQE